MLIVIRVLLMLALAVIAVAPQHPHAAPVAGNHAVSGSHAHHHGTKQEGTERHEGSGHEHPGSMSCCPSLSMQCGGAALALDSHWSLANTKFVEARARPETGAGTAGALLEFEPPPPRS